MTYFELMPNYNKLDSFVTFICSCCSDIWSVMCQPFIDEYCFTSGGGIDKPTWSYLIPLMAIGFTFIIICFAKKLITKFLEGV